MKKKNNACNKLYNERKYTGILCVFCRANLKQNIRNVRKSEATLGTVNGQLTIY